MAYMKWTAEKVRFLIDNYGKLPADKIAVYLDTTPKKVKQKAHHLRITKPLTRWTKKETHYLQENWGKLRVTKIAASLNRTETAVVTKASKLKLGPSAQAQGLLTATDLANIMGVELHTVTDYWIRKCDLKAVKKKTLKSKLCWQIDIRDWWKWAKKNQDKFDSRRIELLALGAEPPWMKAKRQHDIVHLPKNRFKNWTATDDARLNHLLTTTDLNYKQIGKKLGRSELAIAHRIGRLNNKNKKERFLSL